MEATRILDKHYTVCININSLRYDQMNIHQKINVKSFYQLFSFAPKGKAVLILDWMQSDRVYSNNYQEPYRLY